MPVAEALSHGLENNDWSKTSDHARGCYFSGHSQGELLELEYFSVQIFHFLKKLLLYRLTPWDNWGKNMHFKRIHTPKHHRLMI